MELSIGGLKPKHSLASRLGQDLVGLGGPSKGNFTTNDPKEEGSSQTYMVGPLSAEAFESYVLKTKPTLKRSKYANHKMNL